MPRMHFRLPFASMAVQGTLYDMMGFGSGVIDTCLPSPPRGTVDSWPGFSPSSPRPADASSMPAPLSPPGCAKSHGPCHCGGAAYVYRPRVALPPAWPSYTQARNSGSRPWHRRRRSRDAACPRRAPPGPHSVGSRPVYTLHRPTRSQCRQEPAHPQCLIGGKSPIILHVDSLAASQRVGKRFAGLNHTSAFNAFRGHVHGTVFRLPDTRACMPFSSRHGPWIARWLLAKGTDLLAFIPVVRSSSLPAVGDLLL